MSRIDVSVVIPSYNQAATICDELQRIDDFLQQACSSYEIILVIDGNQDQTFERVQQHANLSTVRIEHFAKNKGKGAAIRHGFSIAQGNIIGFIDAGGDMDFTYIELMLLLMRLTDADIVIGSKRNPYSVVQYPQLRRIYSAAYQLLIRLLFNLNVSDTQVGLKFFKADVVKDIIPLLTIERFAFDVEFLALAAHRGHTNIIESPVHINHQFHSSINMKEVLRIVWDTLRIRYALTMHLFQTPRSQRQNTRKEIYQLETK